MFVSGRQSRLPRGEGDNGATFISHAPERGGSLISGNGAAFPGIHLPLSKFEYEKHIQVKDHLSNDTGQSFDLLGFRKKFPFKYFITPR